MFERGTRTYGLAASLLVTGLLFAAASCGPEEKKEQTITYDEMSQSFTRTLGCDKVPECELKAGLAIIYEPYCHPDAPARPFGDVNPAENDRITFDAGAGRKCLDALRSKSPCEVFSADELAGGACSNYLKGQQSEGDACLRDNECRGELTCRMNDSCPGTCRGPLEEGDDCTDTSRFCREGLYCDETCKPRKAEGEDCATSIACQSELYCADEGCQPRKSEGSSCDVDAQCEQDLECGDGGVCTAPADEDECSTANDCPAAQTCVGGTCQQAAAEGESCESLRCRPGLRCAGGTCVDVARPGESCESSKNCVLSHYCKDGTCQPRPTLGEDCSNPPDGYENGTLSFDGSGGGIPFCIRGECTEGTCQKQEPGASCRSPGYHFEPCEGGYCDVPQGEETGTCRSLKSAGETCRSSTQCSDDMTCQASEDSETDVCGAPCTIE